MEPKTSRYQSRILREMHQNTENPFNSPPSSTGSHDSVTVTSDFDYDPQGESTRRMADDSFNLPGLPSKHGHKATYHINADALQQDAQWKNWKQESQEHTTDIYNVTGDLEDRPNAKENAPPPSSSTAASPTDIKMHEQRQSLANRGYLRTRSQMQARVDNESDCGDTQMSNSSRRHAPKPKRGNVTSLIQSLKAAQAAKEDKSAPKDGASANPVAADQRSSPKQIPSIERIKMSHQARANEDHTSPQTPNQTANQTARSFFLPNLAHINDFITGALEYSSTKNGMPVFVKNGKVYDNEFRSPGTHANLGGIELPEDEQKIFVSLDKIRDEIQALQAHDDQVSRQAEELQEEIYALQMRLTSQKTRKDSAMGSDSDSSLIIHMNTRQSELEEKAAALQSKLDKANRKISINEIHNESYILERDEALNAVSAQRKRIERLEAELAEARKGQSSRHADSRKNEGENMHSREEFKAQIEELSSLRNSNAMIQEQNQDLQEDVGKLQQLVETLQGDNHVLESEYKLIIEEKQTLRQDNLSLERQNEKYYQDTKMLQQKNSQLERRVNDLQDDNSRLLRLIDSDHADAGTATLEVQDLRDRLERKNKELAAENAQLQQQMARLQADHASKRLAFEQEKQRLEEDKEYLQTQIERISKRFERVVQQAADKDAEFEEKQSSLTQQLQEIVNREAALATRLQESADQESTLQRDVQRKNEAIEEAQRITREIRNFKTATTKPAKVTRIVEPSTSRIRSTTSDMSLRNTASQTDMMMEDDYTQQLELSQGSDFASALAKADMDRLRDALRQNRSGGRQQNITEDELDEHDPDTADELSRSLPLLNLDDHLNESPPRKARAANAKSPASASKRMPSGILKNTQHARHPSEQDTGRFSVKSGMSGMSLPSQTSHSNATNSRRRSEADRFDVDADDHMTSALFMDDITLDTRRRMNDQETTKKQVPSLSRDAKRVLDGLCHDHDCSNCMVCTRIKGHKHDNTKDSRTGKVTVRVERPVPVSERMPNTKTRDDARYDDQPTLRPSRNPADALATVLKHLEDELEHIKANAAKKSAMYNSFDPSFGKRQRKQLNGDIQRLLRMQEMKMEQIYQLYDVVEGHKRSGQEMSMDELEITMMSIQCKDDTWDGIMD